MAVQTYLAMARSDEDMDDALGVTIEDFRSALGTSNPSAIRETVVEALTVK